MIVRVGRLRVWCMLSQYFGSMSSPAALTCGGEAARRVDTGVIATVGRGRGRARAAEHHVVDETAL